MKKRSVAAVIVFGFITLGIYSWYWAVKTKGEMNQLGEKVPTAWLWLIPIVGFIIWNWKYSEAVEHVSQNKLSGVLTFVLLYFLGSIGQGIVQDTFNKLALVPGAPTGDLPTQPPVPPTQPVDNQPQPQLAPTQPVDSQPQAAPTPEIPQTPLQAPPQNDLPPNTPDGPTIVSG